MGNIHVKLYKIRTSGLGGDIKKKLTEGWTEGGRKTDHISSPQAKGSGELKIDEY